jgi:hypothetical protein
LLHQVGVFIYCGSVSHRWHLYFKLFQNCVNVVAAIAFRSQLCDQHQSVFGRHFVMPVL